MYYHQQQKLFTGTYVYLLQFYTFITANDTNYSLNGVYRVNWVKIHSYQYQRQDVLALNVQEDRPQFGIIRNIFVYSNNEIIFSVYIIKTICFIHHYHAYQIETPLSPKIILVHYKDLLDHIPLSLHKHSLNCTFVSPRYAYASL